MVERPCPVCHKNIPLSFEGADRPSDYSIIMDRPYNYTRREKPYFEERIDVRDFFRVFVVESQQSFERIRAQSGAFLISAFHERFEEDEILGKARNTPVYHHYRLTVPADRKEGLLDELEFLNINRRFYSLVLMKWPRRPLSVTTMIDVARARSLSEELCPLFSKIPDSSPNPETLL